MVASSLGKIHLCIDGYTAETPALRNEELLGIYFRSVKKSAFTRILYFPDDSDNAMEGVTGCMLGAGYHTTVHTYTNKKKQCYFLDFFGFEEKKHRNALNFLSNSYEAAYQMQHSLLRQPDNPLPVQHPSGRKAYGPHLMAHIQIQQSQVPLMRKHIRDFLTSLPYEINMNPLTQVFQIESKEWQSALRVIAESHLAIHFHIPSRILFIDIFSCKPFESSKVLYLLKEQFMSKTMDSTVFERGLYFPEQNPILTKMTATPLVASF